MLRSKNLSSTFKLNSYVLHHEDLQLAIDYKDFSRAWLVCAAASMSLTTFVFACAMMDNKNNVVDAT